MIVNRILDEHPVDSIDAYIDSGGGVGLAESLQASRSDIIGELLASGLRGRGGAGFPTGKKWQTIHEHESGVLPTTVVVNAAEGEPGSFKDRALIRSNPYRVIEGALVAAHAFSATNLVIAIKSSFSTEAVRLRGAVAEIEATGWDGDVDIEVFEGPGHYLYGEETGLLEALDGRPPFPRIAPPWRRGVVEVQPPGITSTSDPASVELASESADSVVPPALVNNVETVAHIPTILANGSDWFRQAGTDRSPGTIVCTITGSTQRHGVAEFEMGTPLIDVIDSLGGGPIPERTLRAALSGVSNPLLFEEHLATPLTHEDMTAAGSGLGATGFIIFDDRDDLVEVVRQTSRFLAVESCGQCRPCKVDGLALAELLGSMVEETADAADWNRFDELRQTVTEGARCYLAHQQAAVTQDVGAAAVLPRPTDPRPVTIAPIVDIVEDRAILDTDQLDKQPDWTVGDEDSGQSPADRLGTQAPVSS